MAKAYSDEKKSIEEAKEANWLKHFAEYGRGVSMYRTTEIYELILDGIPDKLRCELWLIFSGAIHQVLKQLQTNHHSFKVKIYNDFILRNIQTRLCMRSW